MTRIETSRVREVLGMTIAAVQDAANKLNPDSELQNLESDIDEVEKAVSDLKASLAALPYKHSE